MSRSLSPEQFEDLCNLIQALHNEEITPEEADRLEQWVLRDKEAGLIYVQYMNLYCILHWGEPQESAPPPSSGGLAPRCSSTPPILGLLGDVFHAGASWLSRSFVLTLLAAIGLPTIVFLLLLVDISRQPVPEPPVARVAPGAGEPAARTVAEIAHTHRAKWDDGQTTLATGARLPVDRQLRLREGLVEVVFDKGARVVLEGPAVFGVRSENDGFLHEGMLAAKVPPAAHGFTVQTPVMTVVDLGTEFGVAVADNGISETHVFVGRVELAATSRGHVPARPLKKLSVGQAARVSREKAGETVRIDTMGASADRFARRVPSETTAGLPDPKILFAHRGKNDPTSEGWKSRASRKVDPEQMPLLRPVDDNGTAAWSVQDRSTERGIQYRIEPSQGLTQSVTDDAKKTGWVLRARIKVSGETTPDNGLAHCAYRDDKHAWVLQPGVGPDGDQQVVLFGRSSLGTDAVVDIPDSSGRYVQYEMRYHPETDDADVYVDGRCVATRYRKTRGVEEIGLQFGTEWKPTGDARFALLEWGPLGEEAAEQPSRGK